MTMDDLKLRVPREVKQWLKERAQANCRTVNGEILALLKATRRAEQQKAA